MYYSEEIIEEVRIENDIVDVVSEYIQLKKKGSSYFGLCPFHNESTPSFSVSPDKQMYYCFGCGAGGNVLSFLMQMENYDFVEAVKYLAARAHVMLPEPEYSQEAKKHFLLKEQLFSIHKEAAKYFYYNLYSERGTAALEYLEKRKTNLEVQKTFGLGYSNITAYDLYKYLRHKGYEDEVLMQSGLINTSKKSQGYMDRFWNRLMFPIFDVHGRIIGFGGRTIGEGEPKYLNSPETTLFHKGKNLYGLHLARVSRKQQILMVEGYMDVISLYQAGFHNVVATLGTACTSDQGRLLRKYASEVVIIYDSDEAGINASLRAIPILVSAGLTVRVLQISEGKDPDEYIKQKGRDAFEQALQQSKSHINFQVDVLAKKFDLHNTEQKVTFTTEVAKILAKLSSAIEQDAYMKQIAKDTSLSENAIQIEIGKMMQREVKMPKPPSKPVAYVKNYSTSKGFGHIQKNMGQRGIIEAQKNLIYLLATNPVVYEKVGAVLSPDDFLDDFFQRAATLIFAYNEKRQTIHPAEVVNSFVELEEQKLIAQIFNGQPEYKSGQALEKAVNDQVKLIKRHRIDIKARTSTDIEELQKLIEEKRRLENLYILFTDG